MARTGRPIAILALLVLVALSEVRPALASQARAVKDGWLVLKVHSELVDEDLLSDIDVEDGVVTLRGTVATEAGRARALEVARKNDGVKSVVDRLTIAAPQAGDAGDRAGRAADKAERTGERAADKAPALRGRRAAPLMTAAQRPERAGKDRAGATRAREHFDDAEHLHARRRCVAPQGDRGRRARTLRVLDHSGLQTAAGLEGAEPARGAVD
jgi:hypothetical protein